MRRLLLFPLLLLLGALTLRAQDATPDPAPLLSYGVPAAGTINNRAPRATFAFDGLRGEVVTLTVSVTDGTLDPLLLVMDAAGNVLAKRDDTGGTRAARIEALRLPDSGRYTVVVTRFGVGVGSTSGGFTLLAERVGVSSASGSALRYGDSLIYSISDMEPQVYYTFQARQGDIIVVSMTRVSGSLDAYLQVVDAGGVVIGYNDDVAGLPTLDARIENLLIPADGTYIIIASRFGQAAGGSTGTFVLTLEEADDSGLRNTVQAAQQVVMGSVVDGELTDAQYENFFVFDAQENDLMTVRVARAGGRLDPFVTITDANLRQLVSDDDSGGSKDAAIDPFLVPATGRYYIIVTRFEGQLGTSVGRYRLEVIGRGNAFDGVASDVPRITYGMTVTGRIDDLVPELLFAFWGRAGDTLTVSMNRGDGNLDPSVGILDDTRTLLVGDDDSGGSQNARIERYTLPRTGVYYLRAGRYSGTTGNPNTFGSFLLTLARRADS